MKAKMIDELLAKACCLAIILRTDRERCIAEISFKAGYKEALKGAVMEGGYESVKKVGMRKVVEWIRKANHSGDFYYSFDQAELQAFLEEQGL